MEQVWVEVLGLIGLLLASGFFSGSETALTAASYPRMQALEKRGNKNAALVNKMRKKKDRLIGGLLLGNILVNISMGVFATWVIMDWIGGKYIWVAILAMTILVLLFAEVLPKTYARLYPNKMSLFVARPVAFFIACSFPITWVVERVANMFFRLLGIKKQIVSFETQEEELRGALAMMGSSVRMDTEGMEKRAMLRSILDLADIHVEEIMVHRKNVKMIDLDNPISGIVDEVLHSAYTRHPVYQGNPDNIVGVLHAKRLLQELRRCEGDVNCIDMKSAMMEPWFIPESTTLFDQLQAFRRRREHFAVMVDEYGALMGVVTLEDILEEIVGQIDDEHDIETEGVRPQLDGHYLVDGNVTIRDLNRDFDWDIPSVDYSTVAGLLLFESQRIPRVGQTFLFHDFKFTVMKKQRNQIMTVKMKPSDILSDIA